MTNTIKLVIVACFTISLTGCLAAAAGAGAGAMYLKENYKVSVQKKDK